MPTLSYDEKENIFTPVGWFHLGQLKRQGPDNTVDDYCDDDDDDDDDDENLGLIFEKGTGESSSWWGKFSHSTPH